MFDSQIKWYQKARLSREPGLSLGADLDRMLALGIDVSVSSPMMRSFCGLRTADSESSTATDRYA